MWWVRLRALLAVAGCLGLFAACGSDGSSSDVVSPDDTGAGTDGSDGSGPGDDTTVVDFPPFEAENNYALLEGDALGEGTEDNAGLVKEVSLTVTNQASGFTLGTARIARRSTTSDGIRLGIVITNTGSEPRCQVALRRVSLQDAAGVEVATEDLMFVHGSVGALSNTFYVPTCLAPGETSWLTDISSSAPFDQVDQIVADELDGGEVPLGAPNARVIPQSYAATAGDMFFTGLEVVVLNEGTEGCVVKSLTNAAILLDENGDFLWYAMPSPPPETTLDPAGTLTLSDNQISFKGSASRVAFRIYFDALP